eukprot:TRINITY_DN7755_c0_g1_i1.p1 TRINITY_DN7755_c0_g1~~TRINITY_DN7755_c0_g1_i1.p1  ORF type:complete len:1064 (-),score=231.91 TRINITY_DN7755_c0_g1_i1:303-3494(-)
MALPVWQHWRASASLLHLLGCIGVLAAMETTTPAAAQMDETTTSMDSPLDVDTLFMGYDTCPCITKLPEEDEEKQVRQRRDAGYGVGSCERWDDWDSRCKTYTSQTCIVEKCKAKGAQCVSGRCRCPDGSCFQNGRCVDHSALPAVHPACSPDKPRLERPAYCWEPWCYVNTSRCAKTVSSSASSRLSKDVGFSYQTCGGQNVWDLDVIVIIQQPYGVRGSSDPYWDGAAKGMLGAFGGSVVRTYRPKDPVEEAEMAQEAFELQQNKSRLRRTVIVAALVDPILCQESTDATNAKNCQEALPINHGGAYYKWLRSPATLIFLEVGPSTPDRAEWAQPLPYVLEPDNREGGKLLGRQWCKTVHSAPREIAVFKGPPGTARCDKRVQGFQAALQDAEDCPSTASANISYVEMHANWSYDKAVAAADLLLTYKPRIRLIFACNARMAFGAAHAASAHGLDLKVLGYDNYTVMEEYIEKQVIAMTVDQQVEKPQHGLPHTALLVASANVNPAMIHTAGLFTSSGTGSIERNGLRIVSSPVNVVMSNMESLVRSSIMDTYDKDEHPNNMTIVGFIRRAQLVSFDINELTYTAVVDLVMHWKTNRLSWDCSLVERPIDFNPEDVWAPENQFDPVLNPTEEQEVSSASIDVNCRGNVWYHKTISFKLGCDFNENLPFYPFDHHVCQVNWRVPHQFLQPVSYKKPTAETVVGWDFSAEVDPSAPAGSIRYLFTFKRLYLKFYVAFFLPCAMLTMVSFQQFWIDPQRTIDRAGLAATSLLASIMLRESAQFPEGLGSYGVYYWLLSIIFHFLALCCTVFGKAGSGDSSAATMDFDTLVHMHLEKAIRGESGELVPEFHKAESKISQPEHSGRYRMALRVVYLLGYYRESSLDLVGKRVIVPAYVLFFFLVNSIFILMPSHAEGFHSIIWIVSSAAGLFLLYWMVIVSATLRSTQNDYVRLTMGEHDASQGACGRLIAFFFPGKFKDKVKRQQMLMRRSTMETSTASRTWRSSGASERDLQPEPVGSSYGQGESPASIARRLQERVMAQRNNYQQQLNHDVPLEEEGGLALNV